MGPQTRFFPELAAEIGVLESLILLQIEFWQKTEGIVVGNDVAVHHTCRRLREFFHCWGGTTVDAAFKSLLDQGLLRCDEAPGGHNKGRYVYICLEKVHALNSIKVLGWPPQISPQVQTEEKSQDTEEDNENSEEAVTSAQSPSEQVPTEVFKTWNPDSSIENVDSKIWN